MKKSIQIFYCGLVLLLLCLPAALFPFFRSEARLEKRALAELYLAHPLWRMCAFTGDPSFERNARLRAAKRRRLYNGRLECELLWLQPPAAK